MRVSVVLLFLKVGDSHQSLSMGRGKSDITCYVRFTRRRNRHRYFLHVSTADLQLVASTTHHGAIALQGW